MLRVKIPNYMYFFSIIHLFIFSLVKVLYPGQGCGGSGACPQNTGHEVGEFALVHTHTHS